MVMELKPWVDNCKNGNDNNSIGLWKFQGENGGFSHEYDHDLAMMVRDFLENNGSGGCADSCCSSDSESGLSDLLHLADKISFYKRSLDQYENDLVKSIHSFLSSLSETDLHFIKPSSCNATCIRFSLVKLLRLSGYDAAVCSARWTGSGKVPGGDHEYIDVVNHGSSGSSERLIIDIDFRSHFEIARPVDSYYRILSSLPVVYVGSLVRLKKLLQVMVEAARSSLKQNSMPVPPWRSLAFLQAKWHSSYKRQFTSDCVSQITSSSDHKQCIGHLKRLQSLVLSQIETERLLKPLNGDTSRRLKLDRWRNTSFKIR